MQLLIEIAGPVLEIGVLFGLFVRRKLGESRVLPFCLAMLVIGDTVKLVFPALDTWTFWITTEFVYDALYLLLGVELAAKLYSHLPWIAPRAERLVLFVLVGTITLVATTPAGPISTTLLPRLTLALAFLYVGLYAIAAHHAVPLVALHRTILRGFTPCLVVFAVTWRHTGDDARLTAWINSLAFAGLLLALLRAAWRHDTPGAEPETVVWVWPWKSVR